MANVINSNVKAQANKLFSNIKELLLEDNLINKSMSSAAKKVAKNAESDFKDVVTVAGSMAQVPGVKYKDPKDILRGMKKVGESSDVSIKGFSKYMDDGLKESIKDSAAKFATAETAGVNPDDAAKLFGDALTSTKRKVAARTPLEMVDQYFAQPFRDAMASKSKGDKSAMTKAFAKGGSRVGIVAGGTAGYALASAHKNDRTNRY